VEDIPSVVDPPPDELQETKVMKIPAATIKFNFMIFPQA
jgi:hypothetical protein